MKTMQVDVAIMGAGTAGLAAYRAARAMGASVVREKVKKANGDRQAVALPGFGDHRGGGAVGKEGLGHAGLAPASIRKPLSARSCSIAVTSAAMVATGAA